MTVVTKYQDYFKALTVYHRRSEDDRPSFLKGYIFHSSIHHPDPLTRARLADFYANESLKYASKPPYTGQDRR